MSTLMVKGAAGRYRRATRDEVCEAAAPYLVPRIVGQVLKDPRATREYIQARIGWQESERFCAVWLDTRHRVIEFDVLFAGTLDGTSVHPREVVKRCLAVNAAAVVFAHNHPSGVAEPSQADEIITGRLREALSMIDVRLLDHIVVAPGCAPVSFAERGLL